MAALTDYFQRPIEGVSLTTDDAPLMRLSLFWRTFIMLAVLLVGSIIAWLLAFRALEVGTRGAQAAQQVATMVRLTRLAMSTTDASRRTELLNRLQAEQGLTVIRRSVGDEVQRLALDRRQRDVVAELRRRLEPDIEWAESVNGVAATWISFALGDQSYWLRIDPATLQDPPHDWLIWLLSLGGLSLSAAALIAALINRPLKQLSFAASRLRDGDFNASRLDEKVSTSEIREVNIGFNRMAQQLAKVEQDRAVMLAGISHDLRTPLARLRLETELSVDDANAREHMAADIDHLDAIIDKFLDYARPDATSLRAVALANVIEACLYAVRDQADIRFTVEVEDDLQVMGDDVELSRVFSNLIENARRYGKTPQTGVALIHITARQRGNWVVVMVRDHGSGVAPETLPFLTKPFFRGDTARTSATGAGLGLSIVDRTVQHIGGQFGLANAATGGLICHLKLPAARHSDGGKSTGSASSAGVLGL